MYTNFDQKLNFNDDEINPYPPDNVLASENAALYVMDWASIRFSPENRRKAAS